MTLAELVDADTQLSQMCELLLYNVLLVLI